MKATYESPVILVQTFVPNEYVAACGDSGTVYKFQCNAGDSSGEYRVFTNGSNGKADGLPEFGGDDVELTTGITYGTYYHPCGEIHESAVSDEYILGYIVPKGDLNFSWYRTPVYIWTNNNTDIHCTTDLNMSTWETTKS